MIRPRTIAVLYAIFASLAVLLIAGTMPPFQNADEGAHTLRADQISHFSIFPQKLADGETGGVIDNGLITLNSEMTALPFHTDIKVSRAMYVPVAWGSEIARGFPNTAIYPPFFYLPAAAAMALARHASIPLPHALVLARVSSGFVTVLVSTAAIAISGPAAIWLFAILLLPMSMALSAAVTQDGLLLACTALAVALYLHVRGHYEQPYRRMIFVAVCALLTLIGMARPPYAAFALLALATQLPLAWRVTGFCAILAGASCWSALNLPYVMLPKPAIGIVDPSLQLHGLVHDVGGWLPLVTNTLIERGDLWISSFIGYLGWLDVALPNFYYKLSYAWLFLAAVATWLAGAGAIKPRDAVLAGLAMLGACGGMILIQYMTWTVVGAPVVEGIQGRYFLPVALVFGVLLARHKGLHAEASHGHGAAWLTASVLVFPIISIAVTMHALLLRYYF